MSAFATISHPPCRNFVAGLCTYGERCRFMHTSTSSKTHPPKTNSMNQNRIARQLTKILRHGVTRNPTLAPLLRPDGFVPLTAILSGLGLTISNDMILKILQSCSKQRMAVAHRTAAGLSILAHLTMTVLPPQSELFIRANQGHTVKGLVESELLTAITLKEATGMVAIHGTYTQALPLIRKSGGLSRMKRNHVHLASSLTAQSGMRKDCTAVIHVKVDEAIEGGLAFFRSANGVLLCSGDERGILPATYFAQITDREGGVLVEEARVDRVCTPVPEQQKVSGARGWKAREKRSRSQAVVLYELSVREAARLS